MALPSGRRRAVTRPLDPRQFSSIRGKAKKAPEGLLLLVLLISVLLAVASLVMARGPAAGVFDPIAKTSN
jgi:hypothetical protein